MLRIDKAILDTDTVICENIKRFTADRGLMSQNILSQIRNFVEYIAVKIYSNGEDINPNDYKINVAALKEIARRGDLRFLFEFHEMLQKSVSHYTLDRDGSERLMLKYYSHLVKIKRYLKETYGMRVLNNISSFPLNLDSELLEYYKIISERIEASSSLAFPVEYKDRYYVQKVKPFVVGERVYYEITFTAANTNASKFDRLIAFSKQEIIDNYAIRFSAHNDYISILGKSMPIMVIDDFEVSIRPCEWDHFSEVFGPKYRHDASNLEYRKLMRFLTASRQSLTEFVSSDDEYYIQVKEAITDKARSVRVFKMLDECRNIIKHKKPGQNVIRYLLNNLNNRLIKDQLSDERCGKLSGLYLDYRCIPFDEMPFCSSLRKHNPKLIELLESIPVEGREHELLARKIKNNTEIEGKLFTPISELGECDSVNALVDKYNESLYHTHYGRQIKCFEQHLYIRSFAEDSAKIIERLQELSTKGVSQYTSSVDSWLEKESYHIDDGTKKEALRTMFSSSRVAVIYGSAGTGKTTLMKHIANYMADRGKLFLANTHPAVDNMRRKVSSRNCEYCTIARFLAKTTGQNQYDVLFIDECSTVSNEDMYRVLQKVRFKLIVLVGDIYQIESIYFGNWFEIAKRFIPSSSVFELTHPYRTEDAELLTIWDRVRKLDDSMLEPLVKCGCVSKLDDSIFARTDEDEIVLCLNYDGLYGINNLNRFLQGNNPNENILWGLYGYKVGDPILFNESNVFAPLIHNNTKGTIVKIEAEMNRIWFDIELENSINELDAEGYAFDLVGESSKGRSVIRFSVNKNNGSDEDEEEYDSTVVPFQVAYAISIHKAQGLEFNSVKIVITSEIEEKISHNVFYTAITRARKNLKIYWSPETEKEVLENMKMKDYNKDATLLAQLYSLENT